MYIYIYIYIYIYLHTLLDKVFKKLRIKIDYCNYRGTC